jgi:hypothetical protein
MKTRAAFLGLSWLLFVAITTASPNGQRVIGRTIYHKDKSRTESVNNPETREMMEMTYTADNVLSIKKVFLMNEKGEPTQGNVYDGRGNLVARVQCHYDELGRRKEDRLMNLNGETFQQVIHEYGADGKALTPKVINLNTAAAPSFRPAAIDFTKQAAPTGAPVPAANPDSRFAPAPIPNAPVQSGGGLETAPAKLPTEEKPKSNFFKKLFQKKEK